MVKETKLGLPFDEALQNLSERVPTPDLDMVVVFTGGSYWQPPLLSPHQMMTGYVLPSVR